MAFLESPRFPTGISYGASGGPNYSTDVIVANSGFETRNQNWAMPLATYDVAHGLKSPEQLSTLIAFFRTCKGRLNAFRFKDFTDHTVVAGDGVFTAVVGSANSWQMVKQYVNGANTEYRVITKPVNGTITVAGGGTYTVNYPSGIVAVTGGADPTGWIGEFDVPCRFDVDQMKVNAQDFNAYTWGQIPIVEIRV